MILISKAIKSLHPNSEFTIENEDIDTILWIKNKPAGYDFKDQNEKQNKLQELMIELDRLKIIEQNNAYQKKRSAEYPDFRDYLDAIVKGDQTQLQAYIDACNAVKQKYPKPSDT